MFWRCKALFLLYSRFIKHHWDILFVLLLYLFLMIRFIDVGIPTKELYFTYHMDEWHQLMAIRALFSQGTTTIPGAANSTAFFFILSGFVLGFFHAMKSIDITAIQHSLDNIPVQNALFLILRTSMLFYAASTLVVLHIFLKKMKYIFPLIGVLLFSFTPVWFNLSGYFKYDTVLVLCIVISLYLFWKYSQKPTTQSYVLACIASGFAFATKMSAFPMGILSIAAFFLFHTNWKQNKKTLLLGILSMGIVMLLFGVPDVLIGKADYLTVISNVVFFTPSYSSQYMLGVPYWQYLLLNQLPINFGYAFSFLFLFSLIYIVMLNICKRISKEQSRWLLFVFIGLFLFLLSLVPLRLFSSGNRALVLLPFMILITMFAFDHILKQRKKFVVMIPMILILMFHTAQGMVVWSVRIHDPRTETSVWMKRNIKEHSTIGYVGVPTYEMMPDIVQKEYMEILKDPQKKTHFTYVGIDETVQDLPTYIVITNKEIDGIKPTDIKQKTIEKMLQHGYVRVYRSTPNYSLWKFFGDDISLAITNIVPIPTSIEVYERQ